MTFESNSEQINVPACQFRLLRRLCLSFPNPVKWVGLPVTLINVFSSSGKAKAGVCFVGITVAT